MASRVPEAIKAEIVHRWVNELETPLIALAQHYHVSETTILVLLRARLSFAERQAVADARRAHEKAHRLAHSSKPAAAHPRSSRMRGPQRPRLRDSEGKVKPHRPGVAPLEQLESAHIRQLSQAWGAHPSRHYGNGEDDGP